VEIHRLLVEVHEAHFVSRKRVDMVQRLRQRQERCRLKEMTRTPHHPITFTDDNVSHMPLLDMADTTPTPLSYNSAG